MCATATQGLRLSACSPSAAVLRRVSTATVLSDLTAALPFSLHPQQVSKHTESQVQKTAATTASAEHNKLYSLRAVPSINNVHLPEAFLIWTPLPAQEQAPKCMPLSLAEHPTSKGAKTTLPLLHAHCCLALPGLCCCSAQRVTGMGLHYSKGSAPLSVKVGL